MYEEQINAVNAYAEGAKSWMPPTLSSGFWQAPYSSIGNGMWMTTAQQMIPNPRKQRANYKYMQGMSSVEAAGKTATRNDLFTAAKHDYYEWVVLKKKYALFIQEDSLLAYMVQLGHLRYTYNKETLNNIYKAEADLYELRNMQTMLLSDMKMKNVELNTLMNTDKQFAFDIDTALIPRFYEVSLTDTSVISASRSDIRQYDASIALIRLQQQFEQSKRLPEFGVTVSHMQSLNEMPNRFSAMGMITIPIVPWSAREYKANIKGLDYSANAISFQKQSLQNETTGMIASLQSQILSSKQQLSNYEENILPSYTKSYQSSILAYEQNTEALFVVLDGLRMYRMAKMNELDVLNTLLKLQVDYEKELEIR